MQWRNVGSRTSRLEKFLEMFYLVYSLCLLNVPLITVGALAQRKNTLSDNASNGMLYNKLLRIVI